MRKAVLILTQPHESQVAKVTLDHLLRSIDSSTSVVTLINGGGADDLRTAVRRDQRFSFVESPTNLGVAGGRAVLFNHPVAREAEVNVVLDNDIVPTVGLLDALAERVIADPSFGVVGAAIFDWKAVQAHFPFGLDETIENSVLRHCHRLGGPNIYFHLGAGPEWEKVYLREQPLVDQLTDVEPSQRFISMNQNRPAVTSALRDGDLSPIPASNIAGACQAFRRSLVDEIGAPDPIFSPYGHEDVDFCIRAIRAGYRNAVLPDLTMIHGTDNRHGLRRPWPARVAQHRNRLRCRTLIAHRHSTDDPRLIGENAAALDYTCRIQNGTDESEATALARAGFLGVDDAIRQIRMDKLGGSSGQREKSTCLT